jgi:hypothetical protein
VRGVVSALFRSARFTLDDVLEVLCEDLNDVSLESWLEMAMRMREAEHVSLTERLHGYSTLMVGLLQYGDGHSSV